MLSNLSPESSIKYISVIIIPLQKNQASICIVIFQSFAFYKRAFLYAHSEISYRGGAPVWTKPEILPHPHVIPSAGCAPVFNDKPYSPARWRGIGAANEAPSRQSPIRQRKPRRIEQILRIRRREVKPHREI